MSSPATVPVETGCFGHAEVTLPGVARVRVMQVTDYLEPGGKERVAVNIGNLLPRDRYESFLCTTRSEGPLAALVSPDVQRLRLDRRQCVELQGVRRLIAFNAAHQMDILHAHGTSLFVAVIASMFPPYPAVVWHDHYGPNRFDDRPTWLYRLAARRVAAVIAVNRALADWSHRRLGVAADRVWYIPNFATDPTIDTTAPDLPGTPGRRIVCVAHLRPQKDHLTLVNAMAVVTREVPDAHLLLVGALNDRACVDRVRERAMALGIAGHISFLGQRNDVHAILRQCDVGVLSSASEGFPLALIEYGNAELATIATRVGQCSEILQEGRAGILVPAGDVVQLASSIEELLRAPLRRRALAASFGRRVQTLYQSRPIVEQICHVYQSARPRPQ